jgi:hypothetical protein
MLAWPFYVWKHALMTPEPGRRLTEAELAHHCRKQAGLKPLQAEGGDACVAPTAFDLAVHKSAVA